MESDTQILIAAGRALYGQRWHSPLARDLGTTYRTVRYWLDGRHAPPSDLRTRLEPLLRARGLEVEAVLARLDMDNNERTRG